MECQPPSHRFPTLRFIHKNKHGNVTDHNANDSLLAQIKPEKQFILHRDSKALGAKVNYLKYRDKTAMQQNCSLVCSPQFTKYKIKALTNVTSLIYSRWKPQKTPDLSQPKRFGYGPDETEPGFGWFIVCIVYIVCYRQYLDIFKNEVQRNYSTVPVATKFICLVFRCINGFMFVY